MEVGLRGFRKTVVRSQDGCFNPCFNGSWSERLHLLKKVFGAKSFNPCFNGSWSESPFYLMIIAFHYHVSILVLMEVGLRVPLHKA